jgi:AMP deaminase
MEENLEIQEMLQTIVGFRDKYLYQRATHWKAPLKEVHTAHGTRFSLMMKDLEIPGPVDMTMKMVNGVAHVYDLSEEGADAAFQPVSDLEEFLSDLRTAENLCSHGPMRTFCYRRLELLEALFLIHTLINHEREVLEQKCVPHRDFYNIRKVDTHIHHSSCMNQKHLLRFIKGKLKSSEDDVCIQRNGEKFTLGQVFESLQLTPHDLSVDTLDMHADKNTFHRFDRFNLKYSPSGSSRLREIFLKTDNFIKGRYLAELTKEVFEDLSVNKYQMMEPRLSIYGRSKTEWSTLAKWIVVNDLNCDFSRWLIQIPRIYQVHRASGAISCFQDMLDNIFGPLFAVTADPSSDPDLHRFLCCIRAFDCVDDESKIDHLASETAAAPSAWTNKKNPPYNYYMYYLYFNLHVLNQFRESRGFNTFAFRPHAGEAGDVNHLTTAFLTADAINHGILLRKSPVLQYLYYLCQIGIAMSPLSNNHLFLPFARNPFQHYFARGLNVSLSTDDPLQFHFTKEPLMEEYSIAAQMYKLSSADLSEIARNSVMQSGFEHEIKSKWLGQDYLVPGPLGNHIEASNIPQTRAIFRHECLIEELSFVGIRPYWEHIPRDLLPDEKRPVVQANTSQTMRVKIAHPKLTGPVSIYGSPKPSIRHLNTSPVLKPTTSVSPHTSMQNALDGDN